MSLFKKYKTVEDLVPGFLLMKESAIQRKSFYTYTWTTTVFLEWLRENDLIGKPMRKITSDNIYNFFYFIGNEKNLDRPTCEKYFLNLRQLFQYGERKGEVDKVPFDNVVYPRKKKDQGADIIQNDDLKILIPYIKEKDPQLYLACMIQYYCFIRPGKELRLLKIGDIALNDGFIVIRQENAKNKLRQMVTMPQQLIDICHDFEMHKYDRQLFIFGNKHRFGAKPCSINMLRWRFNKIRDELNMPKGYKFYSWKHTGATALHYSGIPMRDLMEQLRHTKLEATQHYIKKHCGNFNNRIRDNFPSPIKA